MQQQDPIFDIGKKPKSWRIEQPQNGEKNPKFILDMELKSNSGYFILECDARIIFENLTKGNKIDVCCIPCSKYVDYEDDLIGFYAQITQDIYKSIEGIREGNNLKIYLIIDKLYLYPYTMGRYHDKIQFIENKDSATSINTGFTYIDQFNYGTGLKPLTIKYNPDKFLDEYPITTREEWAEKVIIPLGMGDRFIIEIPCRFPIVADIDGDEKIEELKDRLIEGIGILRDCIDEYNVSRDAKKCSTNLRGTAELLHNLPHNSAKPKEYQYIEIYKKYLIEKSETGSEEISRETVEDIFRIIDSIFSISSRASHRISRSGDTFKFNTHHEDAEMLLGINSLIYYWIAKKLERALLIGHMDQELEEI